MKKLVIPFGLLLVVLLVVLVAVPRAELYRLAAEQGYAPAQFDLGGFYYNGLGVPQNYAEALKWYRLAAEQGHAGAQFDLASIYANGLGVPQDDTEALRWFRLADEQGIAGAQINIAFILATVKDSKLRNGTEAIRLAQQAVADRVDASVAGMRDTLAAAYAEAGQFDNAVREQQRAIKMLRAGELFMVPELESNLALYRRRQPLR